MTTHPNKEAQCLKCKTKRLALSHRSPGDHALLSCVACGRYTTHVITALALLKKALTPAEQLDLNRQLAAPPLANSLTR